MHNGNFHTEDPGQGRTGVPPTMNARSSLFYSNSPISFPKPKPHPRTTKPRPENDPNHDQLIRGIKGSINQLRERLKNPLKDQLKVQDKA